MRGRCPLCHKGCFVCGFTGWVEFPPVEPVAQDTNYLLTDDDYVLTDDADNPLEWE